MRFYNCGKSKALSGVDRQTGIPVVEEHLMNVAGQKPGAVIVSFPGHDLVRVVEQGEWVDLPDEILAAVVQRACPSLLTEDQVAPSVAAAPLAVEKKPKAKPTEQTNAGASRSSQEK